MKQRITANFLIIIVIVAAIIVAGCMEQDRENGNVTPITPLDDVREHSDRITENILLGMNNDNYTEFSEHFDQTMKNTMSQAVFNETNALIKSKIGEYVSKQFWKAECENQFTIVYYHARFTHEPDNVIIKVVLQDILGEIKVSGLWFDSPKLREK